MSIDEIDIGECIPHRPPFLLLEKIVSYDEKGLVAQAQAKSDDELWSRIFAGHYPGQPITPGVLLCEMIFQAGAAWLGLRNSPTLDDGKVPVVARIQQAKFRKLVPPDEPLEVSVTLQEEVGGAYFMKGTVSLQGAVAASVEFSVTRAASS